MSPLTDLHTLIRSKRIIACVGTGGVGKTTVSSALAVTAARMGRRALVITIDPARRLADALGLEQLGESPEPLSPDLQVRLGIEAPGSLSAMMLDMKGTFDSLVDRLTPDEATRQSILENPIYQHLSEALSGSIEYAAMEKVYELSTRSDFDLIVLDTPPSQHAIDFLEAPKRLVTLLDSTVVKLLVQPAFSLGRFGIRFFQGLADGSLRLIERFSGVGFLKEISEFLLAIESMSSGFKRRAHSVEALLAGDSSAFLLITSPSPTATSATREFMLALQDFEIALAGIVLNRIQPWPSTHPPSEVLAEGNFDADPLASEVGELADRLDRQGVMNPNLAAEAAVGLTRQYALRVMADHRHAESIRRGARDRGQLYLEIPSVVSGLEPRDTLTEISQSLIGDSTGSPGERRP